jgi:tRNA G18 (ribose-2'-O)-methylase SpoU
VTQLQANHVSAVLVAENLQNPDNLGMVLRTADAAGVDTVVVAGAQVDPLHKNEVDETVAFIHFTLEQSKRYAA